MFLIAHGGQVSDPEWLYANGIRAGGYVVCAGQLPSPAALLNAKLQAHLNPFNDGNCGLGKGCNIADVAAYARQAKAMGYSMIAGEGLLAQYANPLMNEIAYLDYHGDIGGYQWDVYAQNPRGVYINGTFGHYACPETYVSVNVMNMNTVKDVLTSARDHGSKGLGILIGSWAGVMLSGTFFTAAINALRTVNINVEAVVFWVGCNYDITPFLKPGGGLNDAFVGIKNAFGVSDNWGAAPGPGPKHINNNPIFEILFD